MNSPAKLPMQSSLVQQGLAFKAAADYDAAYRAFVAAATSEPENPAGWYHMGVVLADAKKWSGAVECFRRADALHPNEPYTLTNLGWYSHLCGETYEAEKILRRVIDIEPHLPIPHTNLAQVLVCLGRESDGLIEAKRAVDCGDEPMHHVSLAFCHFFNQNWLDGFREFRSRIPFRLHEMARYPYKMWDGSKIDRLYLQAEQGSGDTIMMSRLVEAAAARVGSVIWYVQKDLKKLCESMAPENVEVQPMPRALPQADAFIPMMGLPAALGIYNAPYSNKWCNSIKVPTSRKHLKVALIWAGNPDHDSDRYRSMKLSDFLPLFGVGDVELCSLQVGKAAQEISDLGLNAMIDDLAPHISDFQDTFELLQDVDLVITVDTAVAHLAGAMGKQVWALINQRGLDWRWLNRVTNTVWYPSMTLFRRPLGESWADVVKRVTACLKIYAQEKARLGDGGAQEKTG